jgi:hypothetical protein
MKTTKNDTDLTEEQIDNMMGQLIRGMAEITNDYGRLDRTREETFSR